MKVSYRTLGAGATFPLNLVVVIFLLAVSCKKSGTAESASNNLIGKWRLSGYIHNDKDVYGTQVGPCVIDDIITFTNNHEIMLDEGPTKCSATDPQTITGTYSLNSDQTQLTTTTPEIGTQTDDILMLSTTTLKLRQQSNNDIVTYNKLP